MDYCSLRIAFTESNDFSLSGEDLPSHVLIVEDALRGQENSIVISVEDESIKEDFRQKMFFTLSESEARQLANFILTSIKNRS